MKFNTVLSIYIFVLVININAQNRIDSLNNLLQKAKHDTTLLNALNEIAIEYSRIDIDSSLKYANRAIKHAMAGSFHKQLSLAYKIKGFDLWILGDLDSSRVLFQSSIESYKKAGLEKDIPSLYYNIALSYKKPEELDDFYRYTALCKKYSLKLKDSVNYSKCRLLEAEMHIDFGEYDSAAYISHEVSNIGHAMNNFELQYFSIYNLGTINYRLKNFEESLEFYREALEMAENEDDIFRINSVYSNLGLIFTATNETDSALKYYYKSLKISEQLKDLYSQVINLLNIGELNIAIDEFDKAEDRFTKALSIAKQLNHSALLISSYVNLGRVNAWKSNYQLAETMNEKGLELAKEVNNVEWQRQAFYVYYIIDSLKGDYKSALRNHLMVEKYQDSLAGIEMRSELNRLEIKYQSQKQNAEIERQKVEIQNRKLEIKQRNTQVLALVGIVLLVVFFVIKLLIDQRKIKRAKEMLESQNMEIAAQKEEIQTQSESVSKANQALKELGEFKDNMTAMLVHDLKNPLNNVINVSEQASSDRQIKLMQQSGKQMMSLVNDILDVQKYEHTQMILSRTICTLDDIIEYSVEQINPLLHQKNIHIKNSIEDSYQLKLDREIMQRIMINLLTNAIKYSPQNSFIELADRVFEDKLRIFVKDKGVGIPEHKKDILFTKFAQIKAKKGGLVRSTGIGLAFCKIAIEAHGGNIGFESDAGEGTTFWVEISIEASIEKEKVEVNSLRENSAQDFSVVFEKFKPQIEKLRKLDVFEVTEIKQVLSTVESKDNTVIFWKEKIYEAVFNCNSERYTVLTTP